METPNPSTNLFEYATSELSQDAVICWLLAHVVETQSPLYGVAFELFQQMHGKELPSVSNLEIRRQFYNIDVLVLYETQGEKHALIVEDKVEADLYNDLAKYKRTIEEHCNTQNVHICVFRTGDGMGERKVRADVQPGLVYLKRRDVLSILEKQHPEALKASEILQSFYDVLREREDAFEGYNTIPVKDWCAPQWKGFYHALYENGILYDWHYVANPAGGFFCGIVGKWLETDDYAFYLQIDSEKKTLAMRVGEVYGNHIEVRERLRKLIEDLAPQLQLPWGKPGRLGVGCYMALAECGNGRDERQQWLVPNANALVDMDMCIKNLKRAAEDLEKLVQAAQRS